MENFKQEYLSPENDVPLILDTKGENVGIKINNLIKLADSEGFIRAGEVFSLFNIQTQYGSYYFRGIKGYPDLGVGINYKKDSISYHQDKIYKDDIFVFAKRLSDQLRKDI